MHEFSVCHPITRLWCALFLHHRQTMGSRLPVLILLGVGLLGPGVSGLRIGAFNIKWFGRSKMSNPQVADIITVIVSRYDVILIQEVRDKSNRSVNLLLNKLNAHVKNTDTSASFSYKSSPRLGRTRYKERYVYFYRNDRVEVVATHMFTESNGDVFEREPFCLLIHVVGTEPWNLALVGLHAKPSVAVDELRHLSDQVENEVKAKWKTQNVMYLGDFNADCRYARPSQLAATPLFSLPRYTSLIGSDLDTTTGKTHCAYDRIVTTGSCLINAIRVARVYLFDKEFGFSRELTLKVSDHYPVEVELDVVSYTIPREGREVARTT